MSEKKKRPVPVPTVTTGTLWDGIKSGKLLLQYDREVDAWQYYPRPGSLKTGKRNLEWREAAGTGAVYSFTETYVPTAGFEDRTPYLLAMIDLDEGVRILGNLGDVTAADVFIGMPVKIAFEKISEDAEYFCFEPA